MIAIQHQCLPVFRSTALPHQRGLVQRLDRFHQTVMGAAYNEHDPMLGADRRQSERAQKR